MHTTPDDAFDVSNPRFSQTGPEYPPLVKLKIGVGNTGYPTAQFYDQNRELTSIDHVAKGDMVRVIADLGNIWFMNGKFGATLYVHQVQNVQGTRLSASADSSGAYIPDYFL